MGGFHLDKGLCLARNEVNKLNYSTSHSTRLLWVGWWIPIDSSRFFLNDFPLSIGNLDVAKEQQLALMWASHISVSREHRLHHLCSYDVGTNEAHFVLMCPLRNSIIEQISIIIWECNIKGVSCLSFNWIIWSASILVSQRLPHSTTLEN